MAGKILRKLTDSGRVSVTVAIEIDQEACERAEVANDEFAECSEILRKLADMNDSDPVLGKAQDAAGVAKQLTKSERARVTVIIQEEDGRRATKEDLKQASAILREVAQMNDDSSKKALVEANAAFPQLRPS